MLPRAPTTCTCEDSATAGRDRTRCTCQPLPTPPPPPRDDHGDTEAAATSVGVPSETRGELEEAGDVDVFRFRLTSSGDQLVVHTVGGTDTTGELVGPGGLRRSDDDSGAGSNFRITVDDAPAGTYYVHVRGFRNSRTGPYEVYVSTTATPPPHPVTTTAIPRRRPRRSGCPRRLAASLRRRVTWMSSVSV